MKAYEQLNVRGIKSSNGLTLRCAAKSVAMGSRTDATAEFDANSVKNAVSTENTMIIPETDMKSNLAKIVPMYSDNPDELTAAASEYPPPLNRMTPQASLDWTDGHSNIGL